MNDCPNYGHPDVPESRPFNPFGEENPVEPNDSNETGDQQGEIAEAKRINETRLERRNKWVEEIAIALHTDKCKPRRSPSNT